MSGLTPQGFERRSFGEIVAGFETRQRAELDPNINTTATGLVGNFNAIYGDALAEVWEAMHAVYDASDPSAATDAGLDAVCEITGTQRKDASKSRVTLTLSLNAGVTVLAGAVVSQQGNPAVRFVTLVDVENSGGAPDDFDVEAEAEVAGPVVANAGTLTVIETTVSGWTAVTNGADAAVGTNIEASADLRVRREAELEAAGGSTVEAVRVDVLQVADVEDVIVLENVTDETDDGLPPHSICVVVAGGEDEDIARAIWASKPAGVRAYGTTTETIEDSHGFEQDVGFSRPIDRTIYAYLRVETRTGVSEEEIKEALRLDATTRGSDGYWGLGKTVRANRSLAAALRVDGVLDVGVNISTSAIGAYSSALANQTIAMTAYQRGHFDTANVEVDVVVVP